MEKLEEIKIKSYNLAELKERVSSLTEGHSFRIRIVYPADKTKGSLRGEKEVFFDPKTKKFYIHGSPDNKYIDDSYLENLEKQGGHFLGQELQ